MTTPTSQVRRSRPRFRTGELVMAGAFLALGIAGLWGAGLIPEPVTSNTIGPRVVPYVVSGMITISSLIVLVMVLLGNRGDQESSEDADANAHVDAKTVAILTTVLLVSGLAIPWVGWPVASAALFTCVVVILGGSWRRGLIAGVAIGAITQLLFGQFLGVSLPLLPGWLDDLLNGF